MKNTTSTLPAEFLDSDNLPEINTAVFTCNGSRYVYAAPGIDTFKFWELFGHDAKRLSGMLSSSGSSCEEKAFLFAVADCMDPCAYVQFGSSFEDAYESFCDNAPNLIISAEDFARDYDHETHSSYTSDGEPIDTDNVQGFGPLKLLGVTFKP